MGVTQLAQSLFAEQGDGKAAAGTEDAAYLAESRRQIVDPLIDIT
jgi:hypothetical protein